MDNSTEVVNEELESELPLNYFSYFTEIEETFVRRRGKHLFIGTLDWALIETWKQMGVPLHVALRGIEKAFDSWESKPRKRSVNSLLYCQEEVEAQFAEWREARVGAAEEPDSDEAPHADREPLPFSRAAILDHLDKGKASLLETSAKRKQAGPDDFSDTLDRATRLLGDLRDDVAAGAALDARKLEQSLSGLERMITDAVRTVAGDEQIATITREVKEQLQPYRKHMEPPVYQQTFDNLFLKRLREQFAIPRLSLFYL
jgi:hypothetical protein